MRLLEALRYSRPECISFVGAGGKTTALFRLGREILASAESKGGSKTVLVTTSTHLGAWQARQADHSLVISDLRNLSKLEQDLPEGLVLITGEERDGYLNGLHGVMLDELQQIGEKRNLPLLIEADGAHGCPLKAPQEHEPAIPEFSQQVVVVAGMKGLGKPLAKDWVHRAEQFAQISGLSLGEQVTGEAIARVLLDRHGGMKGIPCGARRCVLLNQADTAELQAQAKGIAEAVLQKFDASIIAALALENAAQEDKADSTLDWSQEVKAVVESVAGIILAAGRSSRFGEPKQLLPWKGQPLVRHVAQAALQAGLTPVIVVVGAAGEAVEAKIKDLPVRIVNNSAWEKGMSSSIKAGVESLPLNSGAALFLQADQPQVPVTLIRALVEAHRGTLNPIVAPQISGERGNPVLFDRATFRELVELEGEVGGRALFSHYTIQWVEWHDPHTLIDIDTPEEYAKFLEVYGSGEVEA